MTGVDADRHDDLATPEELFKLATRLFPINRSITGDGVRKTLAILKEHIPELMIYEVPSGTQAMDWTVPDEWNITSAKIEDPNGNCIVDFAQNNLHVVGYSTPVNAYISLDALQPHLHSLPNRPDAIPYVTSYYKRDWGFCLSHRKRSSLLPGTYHVQIDSVLKPGSLTYGELVIPGKRKKEIFFSTYICHPSMANNELSGPVVATYLARWLAAAPREYTYRIIFVPETIGSLVYLSRKLQHLQAHVEAGFVLTCCGGPGEFSFMPSRTGQTYTDRLSRWVLSQFQTKFVEHSFLRRGSDERQYCSPLANLPMVSIMRSKYHEYAEYHTSDDDLSFISAESLWHSLNIHKAILTAAESNCIPMATMVGEPQLIKYGAYPSLGGQVRQEEVAATLDLLAFSDGKTDLVEISNRTNHGLLSLRQRADWLVSLGLLTLSPDLHT